jgi:hypothetical protein
VARVVAVYDTQPQRTRRVAQAWQALAAQSVAGLLSEVDAVLLPDPLWFGTWPATQTTLPIWLGSVTQLTHTLPTQVGAQAPISSQQTAWLQNFAHKHPVGTFIGQCVAPPEQLHATVAALLLGLRATLGDAPATQACHTTGTIHTWQWTTPTGRDVQLTGWTRPGLRRPRWEWRIVDAPAIARLTHRVCWVTATTRQTLPRPAPAADLAAFVRAVRDGQPWGVTAADGEWARRWLTENR